MKVCETGSFSRAAEALNYTQSGISQMMAGLEEELGVQLFARIKKGVILTENGKRLFPYIQEMVNQKDKLRQAAFDMNSKVEGKFRIGSFTSVTAMWLPDVIHFFRENYPKVEVQIFDGNYDEIRDWIVHGQVDCGFLSSIVADDSEISSNFEGSSLRSYAKRTSSCFEKKGEAGRTAGLSFYNRDSGM